jgi:hypothetical protein
MKRLALILPIVLCVFSAAESIKTEKSKVDFTASGRMRLEATDWFDSSDAGKYAFGGSVLRFGIGQKRTRWDWLLEVEQPLLLGLPNDAIRSAPQGQLGLGASYFAANGNQNVGSLFLKQGFVRLKDLGRGNALRLGRFEFIDGAEVIPKDTTLAALKRDRIAHRLIGNFAFSNTGRSFDGSEFAASHGVNNFTAFAGRATQGVFTVHGMNEIDVDTQYGAYTRQFQNKQSPSELRVFFLDYHDGRRVLKVDNRSASTRTADTLNIRVHTVGGHYLIARQTHTATFDLLAWTALQAGSWGRQQHRAAAFSFEAGVQPKTLPKLKPWLRAGIDWSSGDGDATDDRHGTFFQVLPTPRAYARYPYFSQSNIRDIFGEVMVKPWSRLTVRSDFHDLQLANKNDLWYSGGGAFEPKSFGYAGRNTSGSDQMGQFADVSFDLPVRRAFSITGYYAHAFAGDAIKNVYGQAARSNYGYLEFNWKLPSK